MFACRLCAPLQALGHSDRVTLSLSVIAGTLWHPGDLFSGQTLAFYPVDHAGILGPNFELENRFV